MSFRFLGPSQTLRLKEDGPIYRQGEMVPISREQAELMSTVEFGSLRFDGIAFEPDLVKLFGSEHLVNDERGVPRVAEARPTRAGADEPRVAEAQTKK